jgi:(1->4)-alpha-D-glucan 1-alpha-D-glucosylmutase
VDRLKNATIKSLREARAETNWVAPNQLYENAVLEFVADALNPEKSETFFASFLPFQQRIATLGAHNSLVQIVLKLTSPGVPDFYQGSELWDLSLMDPDNRRPVDYSARERMLAGVKSKVQKDKSAAVRALWQTWLDGGIKLYLINALLDLRASGSELFERGTYEPLVAFGETSHQAVCAFKRTDGYSSILVVLSKDARLSSSAFCETFLSVNSHSNALEWRDLFTGHRVKVIDGKIRLRDVFADLPVAVLLPVSPASNTR